MPINETFKDYILEQLSDLGNVTVKKMFGGAGLYLEGVIFALIAGDALYFKVDDSNRLDFERAGMGLFKPFDDKPMLMPYCEVPGEVLEDKEKLAEWAGKALHVSRNSPSTGKKEKKRNEIKRSF